MIDLALKMLLDEKARFAATVLGVGFAAALGAGPGGPLLRPARERQHHDRPARRRPLGHGAEHAERRFRQSVPRGLRAAGAIDTGGGAGRQPDRLVRDRRVADRGEGVGGLLRAGGLPGLAFPVGYRVGRPGRSPPRPLRDARRLGRATVRPVPGRRLPRVSGPPAQDHRPDPPGPVVHDQPDRVPRLPAGAVALARRARAGGRRSSSSGSSPGPTRRPSGARSAAACLTTTSTRAAEWAVAVARLTGSRAPGWG